MKYSATFPILGMESTQVPVLLGSQWEATLQSFRKIYSVLCKERGIC